MAYGPLGRSGLSMSCLCPGMMNSARRRLRRIHPIVAVSSIRTLTLSPGRAVRLAAIRLARSWAHELGLDGATAGYR